MKFEQERVEGWNRMSAWHDSGGNEAKVKELPLG
jgi:hypothetical protein